ncbi:MAG: polyphenol oxidase family protein [Thermoanaerobaculia bacterium]
MQRAICESSIEDTTIGRIVIPANVPPGFALFYTTADFPGRLDPGVAEKVLSVVRERYGIDASLSTCNQVHGRGVEKVGSTKGWSECDSCDALWTESSGMALAIKMADCLPVSIVDPVHHVLANVHSGWRGAVQQITGATVGTLKESSSFQASSASVWLGPSIRACCFEVGEEVVEQFTSSYAGAERFVDRSGARPHVDLVGLTAEVLQSEGFAAERIFDTGLCTRCDRGVETLRGHSAGVTSEALFHSYRRDPKRGGRNLAIAAQ